MQARISSEFIKVLNFLKILKMLKYYGQVLENHIIFCRQTIRLSYNYRTPAIIEKIEKFENLQKFNRGNRESILKDAKKSSFTI